MSTFSGISGFIGTEGRIILAASAETIIQTEAVFTADSEHIFCITDDESFTQTAARNPRVSFITGEVRGNARLMRDGQKFVLIPYRIEHEGSIFERTPAGWAETALPAARPKKGFAFWSKAMRTVSLPLSVYPVLLGTLSAVFSGYGFDALIFIAALVGGVAAHMSVNLFSDYNDFKKGFDTPGAASSHTGVLTREQAEPAFILNAAAIMMSITALCGIYLVTRTGWQIAIFGVIGIIGGLSYTGGPLAAKYRGYGELCTGFLMGPLMMTGSFFAQARALNAEVIILSIPAGMLVAAVTLANNIRDVKDDIENGFKTLAANAGFKLSKIIYYVLILSGFAVPLILSFYNRLYLLTLSVFISLPKAINAFSAMIKSGTTAEEIRASALKTPFPLLAIKLYSSFMLFLSISLAVMVILNTVGVRF